MNINKVLEYVKNEYGTEAEYPWGKDDSCVLRNTNGKWYGIMMKVKRNRLGFDDMELQEILNVKCDPIMVDSFSAKDGYLRAYHMNKKNWLTIILDDNTDEKEVKMLVNGSYILTSGRRRK